MSFKIIKIISLIFFCSLIKMVSAEPLLPDIDEKVKLAEKVWEKEHKSEAAIELLKSYRSAKLTKKSMNFADILLLDKSLSSEFHAEIFIERLILMREFKIWDDQEIIIEKIEKLFPDISSLELKSNLNKEIANLKYVQFLLIESEHYFKAAIDSQKGEVNEETAFLISRVGVMLAQQGKLAEATESMLKSLNIYEELGLEVPSGLLINLGGLSIYLKEWDHAINYLNSALLVSDPENYKIKRVYLNLGTAYLHRGDDDLALLNFEKSLMVSEKHGKPAANTLNNIAVLLKEQGKFKEALRKFEQAEKIHIEQGQAETLAIVKRNIGEIWVELKDKKQAATYFQEAYNLFKGKEFLPKQIELYPVMIDNLEALGRIDDALELMKEFKSKNDELVNVKSKTRIAELQSAFELEKKQRALVISEKELVNLEHEKLLSEKAFVEMEAAQGRQANIRFGLIVIVIFLTVTGVNLVRANRFRARAQNILEEKNEKIEGQHIELQELNKELTRQSLQDKLTGLKNRRYLAQFLENDIARISRAQREGHAPQQLIIMIDLDNFKQINDSFGHAGGDKVLTIFSDVLRSCSRESDVLVRWGGEEFLWFCTDTSIEEASKLCERVRDKFSEATISISGKTVQPTCSLGFAPFPIWGNPENDWEESVKIADTALYYAKHSGRDRWVGYTVKTLPEKGKRSPLDIEQLLKGGYLERILKS